MTPAIDFDSVSVPRLVLRLSLPAMLAQFFNILYSVVDRIFVGKIPGSGSLALAAVGVAAPALTAIGATAYLVGIGASTTMSIRLGQKDQAGAQVMVGTATVMLLALGVILTALSIALRRPILYVLGCSDAMYPQAATYFTIYSCGTLFFLLGTGLNHFIMAQGCAKQGMRPVVIGALTNLILDPILIFGLKLGVAGAAAATVIAQALACCDVLRFLRWKAPIVRLTNLRPNRLAARRTVAIGLSPFLILLLDNAIIIILNMVLRHYGGDALGDRMIACAAVVQSFMTLVYCPLQGITSGSAAVYGYHYGAGSYPKVMAAFRAVLLLCLSYAAIMLVSAQLLPEFFAGLFTRDDPALAAMAASAIRKYTLGMFGIAVQYALVDGLTAMGKVKFAMPLSFNRKAIYIALALILPHFTALENIFYNCSIADSLGACCSIVLFFTVIRPSLRKELKRT